MKMASSCRFFFFSIHGKGRIILVYNPFTEQSRFDLSASRFAYEKTPNILGLSPGLPPPPTWPTILHWLFLNQVSGSVTRKKVAKSLVMKNAKRTWTLPIITRWMVCWFAAIRMDFVHGANTPVDNLLTSKERNLQRPILAEIEPLI